MNEFLITETLQKQLKERGITADQIQKQLTQYKRGNISVELNRPATNGDGVIKLSKTEENKYTELYDKALNNLEVFKFVPASGAATRMFKDILSEYSNTDTLDADNSPNIIKLIENLPGFAFSKELDSEPSDDTKITVEKILFDTGLNYSNLPKGLIKFHRYADSSRTAFEEHLAEAREYIPDETGNCSIHFTVTPEYKSEIEKYLEDKQYDYQKDNIKFNLSYSVQNPSTDTIAVDLENSPVNDENGKLVFRPAGHGALIENLNEIDSEIIFIKNIDNVTTEKYLHETIKYKKVLGGYLLSAVNKINEILLELEDVNIDNERLLKIIAACKNEFGIEISEDVTREDILDALNRPVRVCGVVKNEGEPGGGPFWIDKDSVKSKQIVESAQVDMEDDTQKKIWNSSTHFNPVDIVCSVRDYKGKKYDLNKFIDPDAGIITKKSADGVEIKALELPGLWNGAMANWVTLFVEVPLITFNPVKTVYDLLRKEHQN